MNLEGDGWCQRDIDSRDKRIRTLEKENAALKAEVERLHQAWGKPNTDIINELHRECEITAMMREALERIDANKTQTIYDFSEEFMKGANAGFCQSAEIASKALAREKEMRK